MAEVALHSVHTQAVREQLQSHLGTPPSLAEPGSKGVQLRNPVGSF